MRLFVLVLASLTLALPAAAVTLTFTGNDTGEIQVGDEFDQVIVTDQSHLDLTGGVILEDATFLDTSTGDLFDTDIQGFLEVYDEADVVIHGTDFFFDGLPVLGGQLQILANLCAGLDNQCLIAGTFDNGTTFEINAQVLKEGKVTLVPEPNPLGMFGLGLFGLTLCSRRLRIA